MKITRKQLRALINETITTEAFRGKASPPIFSTYGGFSLGNLNDKASAPVAGDDLIKRVANALANRAADLNILDDIHDSGGDASELFYDFPRELVMRLSSGDDGEALLAAIARGDHDPSLEELAFPGDPEDLRESYGDMNDPYNPDANPGLVQMDMPDADAAITAAEDRQTLLEEVMTEILSAAQGDFKLLEAALQNALEIALMRQSGGGDMQYRLSIVPRVDRSL